MVLAKAEAFSKEDAPSWPSGYRGWADAGSHRRVSPSPARGCPQPCGTASSVEDPQGPRRVLAQCWHSAGTARGHRGSPASSLAGAASRAVLGSELPPPLINPDLQAQAAAQGPPNRLPRLMCPRGGHTELIIQIGTGREAGAARVSQLHSGRCGCQQSARHSSLTHQGGPAWHCSEPCSPAVTHTRCHMSPLPPKPPGARGSAQGWSFPSIRSPNTDASTSITPLFSYFST